MNTPEPKQENAFTIGLEAWANANVGIQEHAVAPSIIAAVASSESEAPTIADTDAVNAAKKHIAKDFIKEPQSAKEIALAAQARRVSRRLLLAERAKYVTVNCPETGITSQLNIPAIPGFALIWTSPLSSLANCRGMAQRGADYLKMLDTQVLAGIAIIMAEPYELFRFAPYDSGAQKNAILRTATKRFLIDAILMIEERIHSQNARYLPPLNLHFDKLLSEQGVESRMKGWLNAVAAAIVKPDIEELDLLAKPQFPIRPVYEKDTKAKYSLMAKKELEAAKKELKDDTIIGKDLVKKLVKLETINGKFHGILNALMSTDGMILAAPEMMGLIANRLSQFPSFEVMGSPTRELVKIIRKDRRVLGLSVEQLTEEIKVKEQANEAKATFASQVADNLVAPTPVIASPDNAPVILAVPELVIPEGLNPIERILWKKKMLAAAYANKPQEPVAPRNLVTSNVESTVTYTKPVSSKPVEVFTFVRMSDDRIFHIYSSNNHKSHMYYVQNDYGNLQLAMIINIHGLPVISEEE